MGGCREGRWCSSPQLRLDREPLATGSVERRTRRWQFRYCHSGLAAFSGGPFRHSQPPEPRVPAGSRPIPVQLGCPFNQAEYLILLRPPRQLVADPGLFRQGATGLAGGIRILSHQGESIDKPTPSRPGLVFVIAVFLESVFEAV